MTGVFFFGLFFFAGDFLAFFCGLDELCVLITRLGYRHSVGSSSSSPSTGGEFFSSTHSRNLRKHLQHNYCIPFKRNFLLRPAIILTHWNLHRSENHIYFTNSIDSISFFRNMRCWHHRPLTSATTIDSS